MTELPEVLPCWLVANVPETSAVASPDCVKSTTDVALPVPLPF